MANTLNGFKVIGDTSMIGAGVKHGGAGQTSTAPSANGENRTLNGFKVVGDTSKIGAKAKETKAVTPSASPQPMGNASAGKNNKSSAQKKSFFEIATQNKAPGRVAENAQPRQTSYAGQLGQVSRNAAAPNSRYNAGNLRTAQKQEVAAPSIGKGRSGQYSLRKGLESVALKGGQQIAQAAGNTAAFAEDLLLAPFELFSGQELGAISDTAPFNTWAKGIQRNGQELQEKYAENIAKGGKAAELFDTYGSATVAAVPQAVLALMTSGASEAGTAAGLASTAAKELSPSVLNTVRSAVTEAAKDPQYWLSFGQVVGDGYESALQDMQASGKYDNNTARTKAALYAIGNGILNAEVEVGGGIQKLPDELKHGAAAWKAWVDSMVDEGKEEVVQGVIERAMQNSVYHKGNPLASLSDENAILNPRTAAREFAGGAVVSSILGGGQTFINSAINARNAPTATQEAPGVQADIREGTYTPTPANAAEGAKNAVPGVETAGRLTSTDNMLRYRSDIDKVFSGDYPSGKLLSVGDTPELLTRYGANPLPMTMTQDAAYKIAYPEGYMGGKHNLGMSVLKQLPYQIENPVAILKSNTQPSSIVLLTAWKDGDKSIIVPLHLDKQGAISVENRIASAYQTGHMQSYLGEADSNVLYTKNNEDVHQLLSNGVQFPKAMADDILAKNNISQAEAKSNRDILSEVLFGKKRADMDAMTPEQQNAVYQANEAGTVGMDASGKVFQIDPEQHIDRRRMETVGGRDVNAFQFDHPELHRYYQEAANALIADADLSLQQPMSRRYERTMEGNAVQQAAQTSPHLRQAMDETGLSRDAIIDAAQRIITDQGQENVAAAKRVELILDDMLSNGYTTMTGEQVGPNSGYLTAKQGILGAGEQARGRGLDDVDAFDTPGDAVAGAVNTPFDTMQAKSDEFYPVNPNSAKRVQNDQRRAPSEVPVVNPDTGRNVEKTVSTILNSPLTSPEMATVYENAIAGGAFDYDVVTDRSAVQQAQAKIARDGWQEVANSFIAKAELGQRITKADTAEAISAYNLAISEGDHKVAFELATAIADAAHDSAQMVQAMNLMNRLTPEGRLLTLRRLVDRMNDRAARQNRTPRQSTADSGDVEGARVDYIDKVTGFTLSDELATNYLMAETDAERAAAWDAITTSIAGQIPSTFMEKANFWRYTSMLTNPTTHIRNIMGNAIQMGARKIKDGIGAAIERAVIKDQSQRTKAVNVDKDLKAFAKGQYETDQSAAMGSGKYSDATAAGIEREIQRKRKMFNGEDVLSRAVQGIGDLNSRALDYEDVIFNRAAYVDSFAQALQAKGVTAAEAHAGTRTADVEAARAYAIEEAQKATYRNTTALSEALSKRGRYDASDNIVERGISFVTDALLPFRKTPANILTTGLDYSPVGLAKGIKEAMFDVKSGKCTAADAVDSIASGLTGTGIFALGAYLAAEGLLHVRAGDDDKEESFERSMGGQDYAIQIGDKSYTLDWALPAAMPLFAGAATMKSVQKGGGTFVSLVDATKNIGSVIWETSMLSALNDLISYWSYADDPGAYLISKAASSYAGQYIPTIGSKVASVFDDTVRKSYVEKGSGQVASDVNYFLQGAAKKVLGARNQLQPMVDMWGNEVSNGSAPERVFQSFLSPGFLKAQDNSPATQEIRRLAKATGDSTVYPAAAEKSYTVKGEPRTLTGEEYTRYAKAMGQTRKKLVEAAVKLPAYKSMSNAEKADYIQNVYKYARETARQQVDPKYKPSAAWIKNAQTSKRDIGVSTEEYLALYQQYGSEKMSGKAYEKVKQAHDAGLSPKEYFSMKDRVDADGNGRVSKAEASAALAGQENRADLWDIICTTNAKNPYK